MNSTARTAFASLAALTSLAVVPLAAAPAQASDDVRRSGRCDASSTWKHKAKPDDGRIEVEAEVDSNVNGQKWNWVLRHNGTRLLRPSAPAAPDANDSATDGDVDSADRRRLEGLTSREREVLVLIREGLANKQVARRLGITERTVKAHLTSVFQRIGVTDRSQAAVWAERHGL